ncbi:FAS1 domain-containing protein [Acephala macrosclerotiorum]|nr:FAS1 domain-containing protein [Acephala macrosclerotiorum]
MMSSTVLALCLSFIAISPSLQSSLPSFTDVLSSQTNLSSFSDVLNKTYPDLLTRIGASQTPITILAPSNAAFAKTIYYSIIGPAFSNNDVGAIRAILDYHVVEGNHPSTSLLPTFQYFPTWLSNSSFTNVTDGQRVGGVMQSGKEMFWVSGQSNRSPGIVTDIAFQGGTVHIIDSLLIPPSSFPATTELFSTAAEPYQLTSFLGATYFTPNGSTSALATILNVTTDITIFAPNNVAMESVASSLTSLSLANGSSTFQDLLKYHILVTGGPFYSTSFPQNGTTISLETLNGAPITISFSSNSFFVNSARILTSDLLLANGVMHVLDNVLSPDSTGEKPNPSLATQVPVLSTGAPGGINVSQAPFTSSLPNAVVTGVIASPTGGSYGGGGSATTTGAATTGTGTAKKSGGCNKRPVRFNYFAK